jgi:o-succinylbenzoate synthase
MSFRASFSKRIFNFNFKARTSRGLMPDKTSWFISVWNESHPDVVGLGECGPLPGLSLDDIPNFDSAVAGTVSRISSLDGHSLSTEMVPKIVQPGFPSLRFAVETAFLDLQHGGKRTIFDNGFRTGTPIPINGLIWMGEKDFMIRQIDQKLANGYKCVKLKIGGLDFENECEVLQYIRECYSGQGITIRLDANGAFGSDAMMYLKQLEKFDIHSIEQPIPPGLNQMADLCRSSPVPIALDEELIVERSREEKLDLLAHLRPQYIVLKPTLHGGLSGCSEWIDVADSLGIGWWITSALESNIGLNSICQFAAEYKVTTPQGLGTGQLYSNNILSPLVTNGGNISFDQTGSWDVSGLY